MRHLVGPSWPTRAATLLMTFLAAGCSERPASWAPPGVDNPLVRQRADPWVHRAEDGTYYFTGTVPEFNRIELRRADRLGDLGRSEPRVIWRKHANGPMSANIWAPELHRIEGDWYIFFSAGSHQHPRDIRLYALVNPSTDPMTGQWREAGRIRTRHDAFALDATTFKHRGQRYLLWAQKDPEDVNPASLYLSAMKEPTTLVGPEIRIARPEHNWESEGVPSNQGASVLMHQGRVLIFYTASATDHRSAIGLLWADTDAELLAPSSWNKQPTPIFTTNIDLNRQGPGHPSFTTTNNGDATVMLYHSREYRELHGDQLEDPNRHTRARQLQWDNQGMPVLGADAPD